MERSASVQHEYASFLIRMWREVDPAAPGSVVEWHGEIEHIQSGRRYTFETLDEVADLLHESSETPLDEKQHRGHALVRR
jgi:hypothetical protein